MAYEHDDPRAADPGSGTPHRIERGVEHGQDLPEHVPHGLRQQVTGPGDGPSAIGHGPDASVSRLDDDLASMMMGGGLLPPVLADVDRDLGFPPPQAPDLATAFLAALDAVDDRRFVTPPPADPEPRPTPERVYDAPLPDTAAESAREPVRESATSPAPPAITHAAYFDPAHHDEPAETPREMPIAGLLTMGDRGESEKPPLVRVFDASSVDPMVESPAERVESATPFRDEALDRDPFDRDALDREPFVRDSFDHDLFDHELLDDPSDAAAALALDESASGARLDEEPEPMTVAEWAATFATLEPVASTPGVFEDGAPIDSTIEQRASEDGDLLGESDAIQDVIPFDEPQPAAATPAFIAPVSASALFGEPAPAESESEPTPLALDALGGFDEPVKLTASPFEPTSFESKPFEPSPFASESFDDVPFGAAPSESASSSFDRAPASSSFDDASFDELALEPTVLEPTVLDDSATFEEPASIDMPVPIEAAEPEVEAEPEPDVLEDLQEYVVFSLGELRCVVPIRSVIEVGRIPDAAPVPNAPAWLHGLGNLRGQVLTLIDLKAFFGVGRIKQSTGRMVVLRADADDVTAAVMVDQVHQIVSLSPSRFREAPATLPERSTQFVWGACDYGNYTMIGLDVDGVLGVEAITEAAAEATV